MSRRGVRGYVNDVPVVVFRVTRAERSALEALAAESGTTVNDAARSVMQEGLRLIAEGTLHRAGSISTGPAGTDSHDAPRAAEATP